MTLRIGHDADRRRRRAFTLVELILVMVLLVVVMSVSIPSLKNFFRGRTLDSEAARFLSLTKYGQSRAISEGIPMRLWIDAEQRAYGLEADGGYLESDSKAVHYALGEDLEIEVSETTSALTTALAGIAAFSAPPDVPAIRFLPSGFVSPESPDSVFIRQRTEETVRVIQSTNRLNYAIASEPFQETRPAARPR